MTTIKTAWLYSALVMSLCGGLGAGYMAAPLPADVDTAIRRAYDTALRECELPRGRVLGQAEVNNSKAKGY
jgi:hypothetical protein